MSDNYIATTNFSESTEALDLANSVQTTGWLSGGVTTIATVTTLDITECFGKIANYSTPSDADTETVRLTEKIGYAPTSIGSDGVVWLAFDGNDSVVEFTSLPSAQERMDYVFFAALQITGGEILSVSPTPANIAYNGISSALNFIYYVIAASNINGNSISAASTDLTISNSGGNVFVPFATARDTPEVSDIRLIASAPTMTFFRVYRNAAGDSILTAGRIFEVL
jgi:hypothetical protein